MQTVDFGLQAEDKFSFHRLGENGSLWLDYQHLQQGRYHLMKAGSNWERLNVQAQAVGSVDRRHSEFQSCASQEEERSLKTNGVER